MKKVLILGATGLIGHQVYLRLKQNNNYNIVHMAHIRQLNHSTILFDARDEHAFEKKIIEVNPDVIVNCMGVLITEARRNPEHAIFLNAYMPHRLKNIANLLHAKLIHISTDCVFSGKKGSYTETDLKDADDIYGRAKALGEVTDEPHLTLRTSVVGPELKEGEELFHWFMRQDGIIQGYTKALWSGVTTLELAKAVEWAICSDIHGLYHVTNGMPISKYDLLMLFKKHTHKDIEIEKVEGHITNKTLIDTRKEIANPIPDYDAMVFDMVDFMKGHSELYAHYHFGG
jgi:dTDP-4-dehydrorhamnose reductase